MVVLGKLLWIGLATAAASDAYMHLRARGELSKTGERFAKYFPFHRSQLSWTRAYTALARTRGLPIWPVYLHWIAWLASLTFFLGFVYRRPG